MIDGKLRCSRCDSWKLPEDFHRRSSAANGRRPECIECHKAYQADYYAANTEKVLAYSAARRSANPEKELARSRAYTVDNPDKRRAAHLRKNGWTVESYEAALIAQGGKCANPGCAVRHTDSKRLYADHCHTTGRPRVLLCSGCNTALGSLGEDSQRIAGLLELNDSFSQID